MAERRMFAKTIIDSDAFLDMPLSTQSLYFHLCMRADDDGFINSAKKIQRMIGCSDDDMRILIAKRFILPFDTGVIVIKHWRIHNYIQRDRYHETKYTEEKKRLGLKENGAYTLRDEDSDCLPVSLTPLKKLNSSNVCVQDGSEMDTGCIHDGNTMDTECIHDVHEMDTEVRLGKDRLDKVSIDKSYTGGVGGENSFDELDKLDKKKPKPNNLEKVLDDAGVKGELREALNQFIAMRKEIKKPVKTEYTLKLILKELDKLAKTDAEKTEIVKQSVRNCWQDVYALKDKQAGFTRIIRTPEDVKKLSINQQPYQEPEDESWREEFGCLN